MNENEKEFERRINWLLVYKILLISRGEFHGKDFEEYEQMWDAAFELLA